MDPDAGVFNGTVYRELSNAIANAPLHDVTVPSEVSDLTCAAPTVTKAKTNYKARGSSHRSS